VNLGTSSLIAAAASIKICYISSHYEDNSSIVTPPSQTHATVGSLIILAPCNCAADVTPIARSQSAIHSYYCCSDATITIPAMAAIRISVRCCPDFHPGGRLALVIRRIHVWMAPNSYTDTRGNTCNRMVTKPMRGCFMLSKFYEVLQLDFEIGVAPSTGVLTCFKGCFGAKTDGCGCNCS
jgi:hypothetical protein